MAEEKEIKKQISKAFDNVWQQAREEEQKRIINIISSFDEEIWLRFANKCDDKYTSEQARKIVELIIIDIQKDTQK